MGGLADKKATVQVPGDIAGMRGSNINLLNYILFGQGGPGAGNTAPNNPMGKMFPGIFPGAGSQTFGTAGGNNGDAASRLQSVFGNLAPQGISQFINQPTPEQQALNTAMPRLNEVLSGNPNQNPQFQQDLSVANQQGGRFGSANEILRGQALTGLFNQRTQAAQTLGMLSGQAGQSQSRQAGFMDIETQRRLQLLMSLLGTSQGASFNLPFLQQPSALDTIGQIAGTGAALAGIPGAGGAAGAGGGWQTAAGPGSVP